MLLLLVTIVISISVVSANENLTGDNANSLSSINEVPIINNDDKTNSEIAIDSNQNNSMVLDGNSSNEDEVEPQVPNKLSSKDIKSSYGTKSKFTLKVLDKSGNPISGQGVTFKIGKKVYNTHTDANGVATLNLNYNFIRQSN